MNRHKVTWFCEICKEHRNSGALKKCKTCSAQRQKAKFAIRHNSEYYLCHVFNVKQMQLLSIFKVSPSPELVYTTPILKGVEVSRESVVSLLHQTILEHSEGNINASENSLTGNRRRMSLFEKVMNDASHLSYDSAIGRFVPSNAAAESSSDSTAGSEFKSSSVISRNKNELHYVKFMEQEQVLMKKIVNEAIILRKDHDVNDILTKPESNDLLPKNCAMCEHHFPSTSLLAQIPFNAIQRWRAEHHVSIDSADNRLKSNQLYNTAHICLFCNQFFDTKLGDTLELEAAERQKMKKHNKLPEISSKDIKVPTRPVSAISRSVEMSNLKYRELGLIKGSSSIGTSQSLAILEVKAKSANSIHKTRLAFHKVLKQEEILRNNYIKLKERRSCASEISPEVQNIIDSEKKAKAKNTRLNVKGTQDITAPELTGRINKSSFRSLPELFVAACKDKALRESIATSDSVEEGKNELENFLNNASQKSAAKKDVNMFSDSTAMGSLNIEMKSAEIYPKILPMQSKSKNNEKDKDALGNFLNQKDDNIHGIRTSPIRSPPKPIVVPRARSRSPGRFKSPIKSSSVSPIGSGRKSREGDRKHRVILSTDTHNSSIISKSNKPSWNNHTAVVAGIFPSLNSLKLRVLTNSRDIADDKRLPSLDARTPSPKHLNSKSLTKSNSKSISKASKSQRKKHTKESYTVIQANMRRHRSAEEIELEKAKERRKLDKRREKMRKRVQNAVLAYVSIDDKDAVMDDLGFVKPKVGKSLLKGSNKKKSISSKNKENEESVDIKKKVQFISDSSLSTYKNKSFESNSLIPIQKNDQFPSNDVRKNITFSSSENQDYEDDEEWSQREVEDKHDDEVSRCLNIENGFVHSTIVVNDFNEKSLDESSIESEDNYIDDFESVIAKLEHEQPILLDSNNFKDELHVSNGGNLTPVGIQNEVRSPNSFTFERKASPDRKMFGEFNPVLQLLGDKPFSPSVRLSTRASSSHKRLRRQKSADSMVSPATENIFRRGSSGNISASDNLDNPLLTRGNDDAIVTTVESSVKQENEQSNDNNVERQQDVEDNYYDDDFEATGSTKLGATYDPYSDNTSTARISNQSQKYDLNNEADGSDTKEIKLNSKFSYSSPYNKTSDSAIDQFVSGLFQVRDGEDDFVDKNTQSDSSIVEKNKIQDEEKLSDVSSLSTSVNSTQTSDIFSPVGLSAKVSLKVKLPNKIEQEKIKEVLPPLHLREEDSLVSHKGLSFRAGKSTRTSAFLESIAPDIQGAPSQLELKIMLNSGEISKKIEQQKDSDDAMLDDIARRLNKTLSSKANESPLLKRQHSNTRK